MGKKEETRNKNRNSTQNIQNIKFEENKDRNY